jgi:S-DNA-T family DNA segregation ATPase FtsK/SpoIIIE
VALSSLPVSVGGLPVVGVSDEDLQPMAFDPRGACLISGPSGSGRTTALATLALAVSRWDPAARLIYLGSSRSPLVAAVPWVGVATDPDTIAALAKDVQARIADDGAPLHVVVIERIADLNGTAAETPLATLITALRAAGHGVVGDGEASALTGFQAPLQALRADRKGFALMPDGSEGTSLFQANLGVPVRADFPPGRGFAVARGEATKVHLAVPE